VWDLCGTVVHERCITLSVKYTCGFCVYQLYSSSESACTTVSFLSVHYYISGVGGSVHEAVNEKQYNFQVHELIAYIMN